MIVCLNEPRFAVDSHKFPFPYFQNSPAWLPMESFRKFTGNFPPLCSPDLDFRIQSSLRTPDLQQSACSRKKKQSLCLLRAQVLLRTRHSGSLHLLPLKVERAIYVSGWWTIMRKHVIGITIWKALCDSSELLSTVIIHCAGRWTCWEMNWWLQVP